MFILRSIVLVRFQNNFLLTVFRKFFNQGLNYNNNILFYYYYNFNSLDVIIFIVFSKSTISKNINIINI